MSSSSQNIALTSYPEKVSVRKSCGREVRITTYGLKSFDSQLAVIAHYLHNHDSVKDFPREEARQCLREYLDNQKLQVDDEERMLREPLQIGLFRDFFQVPFPDPIDYRFTFIDLFAGMGGFRLAMQAQGGKCVFSSEWNSFAQKTYLANFGDMPFGDITKEEIKRYIFSFQNSVWVCGTRLSTSCPCQKHPCMKIIVLYLLITMSGVPGSVFTFLR